MPSSPASSAPGEQWRAALSSRRENIPDVIIVERPLTASRWVILALLALTFGLAQAASGWDC